MKEVFAAARVTAENGPNYVVKALLKELKAMTIHSIDELAKAAMAESPGPWKRDDVTYPISDTGDFDTTLRIVDVNGKEVFSLPWDGLSEKEPVLDFIAAANPEAWLSLSSRVEMLASQLPEEMKDCFIVFRECALGHGWLTATNWVQHECPTCRVEKAEDEVQKLRRLSEELSDENDTLTDDCENSIKEMENLRTFVEKAEAALKPFAEHSKLLSRAHLGSSKHDGDMVFVNVGDIHRAGEAYAAIRNLIPGEKP